MRFASFLSSGFITAIAKIYLYHSSKIAKAGPGYDVRPEHPPVQINSSSPWLIQDHTLPNAFMYVNTAFNLTDQ